VGIIFIWMKPLSGTGGRWMGNRMFLGGSERGYPRSVMYLVTLFAVLPVVGI
jgi:hypothetical protein